MNKKNILFLINKVLSGSSSKDEESQVDQYFYDSFQSKDWNRDELGKKEDIEQRIFKGVSQGIRPEAVSLPRFAALKRYARIAAMLALFLVAGFFGRQYLKDGEEDKAVYSQLLKPGSDIASLELSDGTVLSLEDLKIGEQYSSASFLVRKTEEGNLEYVYSENQSAGTQEEKWNTLKTPLGGKYQIILADGTKVWLNAGSTLVFPEHFVGGQRIVKAKGEMYFEVSHDKTKPFIVQAQGMDIHVLGTSFNLSAYEEDLSLTSLSLIEGSVQLESKVGNSILVPGQKATVHQDKIRIMPFDEESEIAWKNDYFIFKDQNIKEIMKSLARWYDAEIEYEGKGWEDKNFTVRMSKREGIEEILSLIESTKSVRFKIIERRVIVSK